MPLAHLPRTRQVIKVVNLRSGATDVLAAASGPGGGPLLLPNVAAILPATAASLDAGGGGGEGVRTTDLLVLTAVGGWLGGYDSWAPFAWSLLRHVPLESGCWSLRGCARRTPSTPPPFSPCGFNPRVWCVEKTHCRDRIRNNIWHIA